VPAQVSGISVNKQYNRIILDKGRWDGLEPDMAVIAPEGVVGMITDVSEHFSLVMPVINRQFSLSVKIAKNHYFGALAWEGLSQTQASLNEIPNHVNVQTGDTIITSGFSLIFPEGIPVGEVVQVNEAEGNFHQIRLNLFVDFRRLTSVYVVNNEMYEEQIDLLNDEEE
jgi:rod shape-determining protein MreC